MTSVRNTRPRQAVILAGGRGERLRPLSDTVPKHMTPVAGRPFLRHLVEQLRDAGFERFLVLLGYMPEPAIDYFGDGSRLGVRVDYCATPPEWRTARRLKQAMGRMDPVIGLFYCDNYAPLDFDAVWRAWAKQGAPARVAVYSNEDGYSTNNVRVERDARVSAYEKSRGAEGLNGVEIGYYLLRRDLIEAMPALDAPFETLLLPELAQSGRLSAHWTHHRYYGVGSIERLERTRRFFEAGPAILISRDGVLGEPPAGGERGPAPGGWRWKPGSLEALRMLRSAGYKVISLAPGGGPGRMDPDAAARLHASIQSQALRAGGEIAAIHHCSHHWKDGCSCRAPEPGLLFQAQREHDLDLTKTIFVGAGVAGAEAAERAGCVFELASGEAPLLSAVRSRILGMELPEMEFACTAAS